MTTAADVFNNMCQRFQSDKAGDTNAVIQFDLSGDQGGLWNVGVVDGKCRVEEGQATDPTATVQMSAEDYVDMTTGKLNPMNAFMMGKIKVQGDLSAVMKFQTLFT